MGLPNITPMLKSPKVLHLEPTDVCQAACPLCARETNPQFNKSKHHHLTVEQISKHCDDKTVRGLSKAFACGDYGDPAAAKYLFEIFRWLRSINPTIILGMNTNGGIQNEDWWKELSLILNHPLDYVIFSIDGLQDTNHIYRRGVEWSKVMKNAQAFIKGNGSAHWDMLVYRHNESQVDEAIQMAKLMGFRWFRAKVSKRPLVGELEFPTTWSIPINNFEKIDCHALRENSIYIDARGQLHPCCWLGENLSSDFRSISEVKPLWKTTKCPSVCKNSCGAPNKTQFESQWRMEIQL